MITESQINRYAWKISNILCLILFISILSIWYKSYYYGIPTTLYKLRTSAQVIQYLQNYWEKKDIPMKAIYIPTGIYISDLAFESANDLNIIFYVWQHFPLNLPPDIQRGFNIGEEVGINTQLEFFNQNIDQIQIKSTFIEAKIRQQFDYKKYPFDDKIIRISIWPKNYDKNVVLIPDFGNYEATPSGAFIGIEPNIVLREFTISDSYFTYNPSDYDTNFGQQISLDRLGYPYFYFSIVLKRALFSAVIIHVLPLLIGYIILFSILLMTTEKKYMLPKYHFNGIDVITNCAMLFFVLIVVHIGFRMKVHSNQIIYLEYFYLLIYVLMGCVVLNNYIILTDSKKKIKLLHYADNLIPKILYWPVILLITLVISIKVLS